MSSDMFGALARLILALPLVVILIYVVLKYGLGRRYLANTGGRRIKLLEQMPLGPRTTLSLVELGERHYLLAHQDNSVYLVKELEHLPEPEESRVGEVVELRPRAVEDYDLLSGTTGKKAVLGHWPAIINKTVLTGLKRVTGRLEQVGGGKGD